MAVIYDKFASTFGTGFFIIVINRQKNLDNGVIFFYF